MQRAPCSCSTGSSTVPMNSRKSPTRSRGSRSGCSTRPYLRKPPSLPIATRPPRTRSSGSRCPSTSDGRPSARRRRRRARACSRAASTLTNCGTALAQSASSRAATAEPVRAQCSSTSARSSSASASLSSSKPTSSALQRPRKLAVLVEHVRDAAAHAGREVPPGRAEHDDAAAGHVLAAVVADSLDDGAGTGVADREPLAGQAAEVRPAGGGAVENGVADDHVLLGDERRAVGRPNRQHAAGETLADVVVRVADRASARFRARARRRRTARRSRAA